MVSLEINGALSTKISANNAKGKRLIPHVIDEIARREPRREWAQVPVSSDPKDGWRTVTFQAFANAINRCCLMLIEQAGKAPPGNFPTIAYIGPNDARYMVINAAAMKTGHKILCISPRNSQEAQLNLFDATDCHFIAFPKSYAAIVKPLLDARDSMKAIEVASLDAWLDEKPVPHYPFDKTFEEAEWDPMWVLHTSGSTGLPKPIANKHGMFATLDAWMDVPAWEGKPTIWDKFTYGSKRHFVTMPFFHAAGLFMSFMISVYCAVPIALCVPDRPLSSDLVVKSFKYLDIEATVLPPAVLEDASLNDEAVKQLAKLDAIGVGGATENPLFPLYWNEDPELWRWFIFNPNMCGLEWRKHEGDEDDDIYELVFARKDKNPAAHMEGYFYTFPEEKVVSTKDLYRRHPSLPNHWMYYGRVDDIIVFSNGEKLNPVTIEGIVTGHPQVKGAVVVGYMRFQAASIIEPGTQPKREEERQAILESVWIDVQKANEETVSHDRIDRDHIIIASPDKPFKRAGKGTVQRGATVKLYKDEIDQLYDKAEHASHASAPRFDVSSEDALAGSIADMFRYHVGTAELDLDGDFFSAGIDSMHVIKSSRLIRAGLAVALGHKINAAVLTTRAIYNNPSPRQLSRYILHTIERGVSNGAIDLDKEIDPDEKQQNDIKTLHNKYTQNLLKPASPTPRPGASDTDQTVILTGSTGMLGSYILDAMSHSPRVRKIICLNRPDDGGAAKQADTMQERGLDPSYSGKAEFYHIDASQPYIGLSKDLYARLQQEADRVVLNAWPVNFNMPVASFEPHIRGVRHWTDFAAAASKRVAVVFISSIGTVSRWQEKRPVPEEKLEDLSLAFGGYGASKLAASLILQDAAKTGDFPAAAIRQGQIAGPERDAGVWNRQEWFPSIVASSLYIKALPSDLGTMNNVDWTPVERIANLVLEVGGITQSVDSKTISGYYHGVNPSTTPWSKLAQALREFYDKERLPETVSFSEWVKRLKKTQGEGTTDLDKNPGVKLLETYQQMAQAGIAPAEMDMTRTMGQSPTMRGSKAVTPELLKQWCKHWDF
ncbi:nonribosomal peptide synthetase [Apiospora arundinis]|uniref:Nonribosomal peptide synthetase n=1 Tax=Apiospora arundinis TaxID=335852 RepID=A0ABR2J3P0_9PEZI